MTSNKYSGEHRIGALCPVKNIGIFAHVDAGKTTLTEQLLLKSGAISCAGTVDKGTTHTDTMDLERERGISIMSAPISFHYNRTKINLIDTPGHVDFVAEVQRSMTILEGAILVISAKEGVQSHTRLLFNTLQSLGVPTVIFINKIDRLGVAIEMVLEMVNRQLSPCAIPIQTVSAAGTRGASVSPLFQACEMGMLDGLTNCNHPTSERLTNQYLENGQIDPLALCLALEEMTAENYVFPVIFGSAMMGEGIDGCLEAIDRLLPCFDRGRSGQPLRGQAFKVQRTHVKTREVFVKLTAGHVGLREITVCHNALGGAHEHKVTGIEALVDGKRVPVDRLFAGDIGVLTGMASLMVGESFSDNVANDHGFDSDGQQSFSLAKPLFTVSVSPKKPSERPKLLQALTLMADMDPYLRVKLSELDDTIMLDLFGIVQMEILSEMLVRNYDVAVVFEAPKPLYQETICSQAAANGHMYKTYSFNAGVGFRVEPLPLGSGISYATEVTNGFLMQTFQNGVKEGALAYLDQGLKGWPLTDLLITLTDSEFNSVDSTPKDYRDLSPLVVFEAIRSAGTSLLWPINKFCITVPVDAMGAVMRDLVLMRGTFETPELSSETAILRGRIPIETSMHYPLKLQHATEGKGLIELEFDGYEPAPAGYEANPETSRPYYRAHPLNPTLYLRAKGGV